MSLPTGAVRRRDIFRNYVIGDEGSRFLSQSAVCERSRRRTAPVGRDMKTMGPAHTRFAWENKIDWQLLRNEANRELHDYYRGLMACADRVPPCKPITFPSSMRALKRESLFIFGGTMRALES